MEYQDTALNQQQSAGALHSSEFITEGGLQEVDARVIYLFISEQHVDVAFFISEQHVDILKKDDRDKIIPIVS
jgi:hypothetical protein